MSVFQFPFFAPGGITSSTTHNADGSEQTPRYSFGFLGITRVQDVFRDPRSSYFITCLDFCWPPKNSQVYLFSLEKLWEKLLYYWNLPILGGFWLKGSFRWVRLPPLIPLRQGPRPPSGAPPPDETGEGTETAVEPALPRPPHLQSTELQLKDDQWLFLVPLKRW